MSRLISPSVIYSKRYRISKLTHIAYNNMEVRNTNNKTQSTESIFARVSIDDNFHNISQCHSINLHPMWNTCHYEICIMNCAFERVPFLRTRYDDGGITYAIRQRRFSYWELSILEKVLIEWSVASFRNSLIMLTTLWFIFDHTIRLFPSFTWFIYFRHNIYHFLQINLSISFRR